MGCYGPSFCPSLTVCYDAKYDFRLLDFVGKGPVVGCSVQWTCCLLLRCWVMLPKILYCPFAAARYMIHVLETIFSSITLNCLDNFVLTMF